MRYVYTLVLAILLMATDVLASGRFIGSTWIQDSALVVGVTPIRNTDGVIICNTDGQMIITVP